MSGEAEEAHQLLAGGANIEERGGEAGDLASPLQAAVRRGFADMVQLLLENGAEITVQDSDGNTLLHLTASRDNEAVILILLEHGADVSTTNARGNTPLDAAARKGHRVAAERLLEHGADASAKGEAGMTPIHWASFQGRAAVVQMLIEHRANVSVEDNFGRTPEDCATSESHVEIVAMLKAEAVTRAKCVAFAMGHHTRLGVGSLAEGLELEVIRMVLDQV